VAGFTTAFATVALAGIGDKSFLTTLALAARHKARWVFTGSASALTIGAGLWIGMGAWLSTFVSADTVKFVSGVTFLTFGIIALNQAYQCHSSTKVATNHIASKTTGGIKQKGVQVVIRDSFTTTFLAEFGDRTQLALLALAAGPNISAPSIFSGAVAANILLAIAAVSSGKLLKNHLCHKRISFCSGILFIGLGVKILAF
jgi:putative Ca2+/H+ antiporter (TMEM165/GDT1 family)